MDEILKLAESIKSDIDAIGAYLKHLEAHKTIKTCLQVLAERKKLSPDRIDSDELGIDDVSINDVSNFRIERMTDTSFWICCYKRGKPDDERIVFWANVVDGKLIVSQEK